MGGERGILSDLEYASDEDSDTNNDNIMPVCTTASLEPIFVAAYGLQISGDFCLWLRTFR